MIEYHCQFLIDGSGEVAVVEGDQAAYDTLCCGAIAHHYWEVMDRKLWLCAKHYDIVMEAEREAAKDAINGVE